MMVGLYGNEHTWRQMQEFCDRYGDPNGQWARYTRDIWLSAPLIKKIMKNDQETVDTARAG